MLIGGKNAMKKSPDVKFKVVDVRPITRRIPLAEKVCPQCGKTFMGSKTRLYCSRGCTQKARYWRNPDNYRQKRLESYRRQKKETTEGEQRAMSVAHKRRES
jgi:ribosomal protein S27AE